MNLSDWTRRERPGQWPLTGARVALEPLDWAAHGEGLYQAVAAPTVKDIWDYMPIGPFQDQAQFEEIFELVRVNQGWETLVIRKGNRGKVLGMASYMRIREGHGSAEIGCVAFGRDLKRSPEATEAMFLMAAHVFDELGYRRYEWKCHNGNAASRRAAERFGFAFEGVFRNDMVVKGKNRDTAWFAMTNEDWPGLKTAFEKWLAPKNFDAAGEQKRKLESFRS
ncbi:MAG: GNAT family N-acetyltransferase [Henriciella sp.]|nr:GNAT family N-acetyltransferase [Henriciella sp.]